MGPWDYMYIIHIPGTLKPPSFHLSSSLLQATPLGCVPGRGPGSLPTTPSAPPKDGFGAAAAASGHPGLGTLPGRRFSENINHNQVKRVHYFWHSFMILVTFLI